MDSQKGCEATLHNLRKQIDGDIKFVEQLMGKRGDEDEIALRINGKANRELELVRTNLQMAKMWAGKCLEQIGSPFPDSLRDESDNSSIPFQER